METVLVTGGAGYIGSVLCKRLLDSSHDAICLDRFYFGEDTIEPPRKNPRFKTVRADIRAKK